MSEPSSAKRRRVGEPAALGLAGERMEELRRLLLAPEQDDLAEVRARVEDLEGRVVGAEEVGRVLPEAVALRGREDDRLARALGPTVEESLRASIQRDPQPLADALFPIIGPAIRKSITEALSAMLEAVNRALEHSLSPSAVRWRVEAWRTGQSFSQIVLRHTLRYRVEQVFLIDEETGLPLQHVAAEAVDTRDTSLVSGMLTAIQDFVQDSFGAGEQDTLATMQVGELTVWIEQGPHAMLAVVIRGIPAPELRTVLQDVIETVHLQFEPELNAFDGDPDPLAGTRPLLQEALLEQYQENQTIRFIGGGATPAPGQEAVLDALVADVRRLQAAAGETDRRVRLQILGHASTEGDPSANRVLSRRRAEAVRRVLAGRGLPLADVEVIGTGTPLHPERTEADRLANRSVSFQVLVQ